MTNKTRTDYTKKFNTGNEATKTPVQESTPDPLEPSPVEAPVEKVTKTVTCQQIYFRSKPVQDPSTVLAILDKGTVVTVESEENGWSMVRVSNDRVDSNGYLMSKYLG